jgi:hypothetical protein
MERTCAFHRKSYMGQHVRFFLLPRLGCGILWPLACPHCSTPSVSCIRSPRALQTIGAGTMAHKTTCRTQHTCHAAGILVPRPTPDDRGGCDAGGGGDSARSKACCRCFSRHTSCLRAALTRISCTCACRSTQHVWCWQLNDGVAVGSSISIGPSYTTSCVSGRVATRRSPRCRSSGEEICRCS